MKKLKIYSTLLIVFLFGALIADVFSFHSDTNVVAPGHKLEFISMPTDFYTQDSIEGGVVTYKKAAIELSLYVRPYCGTPPMIQSTWHDAIHGGPKNVNWMDMEKVKLKMPATEEHQPLVILTFIAFLPSLVLIVWIVVLAIKLTRRIRKGEVFVANVSKGMERTGWLLVLYYLLNSLISYVTYLYASYTFHIAYYHIAYHNETSSLVMILGFVLLIVSQVILMGKDLKDEQELTI